MTWRRVRPAAVGVVGALAVGLGLGLGACHSAKPAATAPTTRTTAAATSSSSSSTATSAPTGPGRDWLTFGGASSRVGAVDPDRPMTSATKGWASDPVDGSVYAQPLLAGGLVIVATEADTVFAFERATGKQVWRTSLGTPVSGSTLPCGNIDPSGITSTPVVDPSGKTVYAAPFIAGSGGPHHELVALDVASGAVRWRRALDPPGLDPKVEQVRGALAWSGGRVYVPFGGLFGDCGPYKGAVMALDAGGSGPALSYVVPTSREGGIWAPAGPMVGADGSLFVSTGNTAARGGAFDGGNAVVRLTPDLKQADLFAPADWAALNNADKDLGSVSPVAAGAGRLFTAGKSGLAYLLDPARLGGIGHPVTSVHACGLAIGGAAVAGDHIVVSCADAMVGLARTGDSLKVAWSVPTTLPGPPTISRGVAWWFDRGGTLHGTALADGRQVTSMALGSTSRFASVAADGDHLFVAAGQWVRSIDLR